MYERYLEKMLRLELDGLTLAAQRCAGEEPENMEALRRRMEEARAELDHMEEEMADSFFALPYLHLVTNCSAFEKHFADMLFCHAASPDYRRRCPALTAELAVLAYEGEASAAEGFAALIGKGALPGFFLDYACGREIDSPLVMDARIVHLILTNTPLYEPYLSLGIHWETGEDGTDFADEGKLLERLARLWDGEQAPEGVYWICGPAGSGKRTLIAKLAGRLQKMFLRLDGARAEEGAEERILRWKRECALWQAVPVLVLERAADFARLLDMLAELPLLFVLCEEAYAGRLTGRSLYPFSLAARSMEASAAIWRAQGSRYPFGSDLPFEALSGKFCMTPGQIGEACAVADTFRRMEGKKEIDSALLHRACRTVLQRDMGRHARRVDTVFCWEDLILPAPQKESLRTAVNQMAYRRKVYETWGLGKAVAYGRGLSMLFAGAPGTGKTMAASVMAGELGMELYCVDLASVVSKYIGETEKNLEEIFTNASQSQAVLFFDEADVLFSKRTEVKDANDKYSNLEAAFLLQRMESYGGVTILATNFLQNIDEAFRRRLKFIIDFPFPDEENRMQIWEKMLPAQLPAEELDLEFLSAHFALSGSNIKNIVVHAAFLSAAEDARLGMRHILLAIKNEYAKLGKSFTPKDAGEYYVLVE